MAQTIGIIPNENKRNDIKIRIVQFVKESFFLSLKMISVFVSIFYKYNADNDKKVK